MTRARVRGLVAGLALAALVALVLVLALGKGTRAPADRAAGLVPADALAFVHASTDPDRDADEDLLERLGRFPAFDRLRGEAERALAPRPGAFDVERDIRPWLGKEAAVAVLPGGVLALFAVADQPRAQGVLLRVSGAGRGVRHRGVLVQRSSGGAAASFVGGFLVVGPEPLVERAIDVHAGAAPPLARRREYVQATRGRPRDRVLDAWAASAGALGDAPFAPGGPVAVSAAPAGDDTVRLTGRAVGAAGAPFAPELLDAVPEDAVAYLGLRSLAPLTGLLPEEAAPLVDALRPVSDQPELALSVTPATPEPVVTLVARAAGEAQARSALAGLQEGIAELLVGTEDATGQVPTFQELDLGEGLSAFALRLAGGGELVSAVAGSRVLVSNAADGIRAAVRDGDQLRDTERFEAVVTGVPAQAEALGYVDVRQLLALAEQAGLTGARAFEAVRGDLRRIRTLGAVLRRQGTDTTAEIVLQIP